MLNLCYEYRWKWPASAACERILRRLQLPAHPQDFRILVLSVFAILNTLPSAGAQGLPELPCLLHPNTSAAVSAPIDGVLESVSVERGDKVKAGQMVARLRSQVEEAIVALARARVAMDAEIKARQTSLEFARRRQKRTAELSKKKTISHQEMDEADTEAVLAGIQLMRARQEHHLAEIELQRAEANLELRVVRSPVNGVVMARLLSPGESVESRPIMRIAEIDPLRVEVIVPVAFLGKISNGMSAQVKPEAPLGGVYTAKVVIVDHVVDAASGTFGVRLELPNPDYAIAGGLRCTVRFVEG